MRRLMMVVLGVVLASVALSQVLAQDNTGGQGREGRRRNREAAAGQTDQAQPGGPGNFDRAAMMQRMAERYKEELGATDEEWKVLQPKIEKVVTLQMQTRMGGMMGRRGMGPGGENNPNRPQSEVATKAADLRKVLEDKSSKPESVKEALKAYRQARDKAKTDLTAAQKDLKSVVTPKQEAQLVLNGLLD